MISELKYLGVSVQNLEVMKYKKNLLCVKQYTYYK